jgi:hypothetical protein
MSLLDVIDARAYQINESVSFLISCLVELVLFLVLSYA